MEGWSALHVDSRPGVAPLLHPQWEYYLIIKRSEVIIHAATWMNLESMLSERSQSLGIMQTVCFCVCEMSE